MFTDFEIYLLCLWAACYVLNDTIRNVQEMNADPYPYAYENVSFINANLYNQYM